MTACLAYLTPPCMGFTLCSSPEPLSLHPCPLPSLKRSPCSCFFSFALLMKPRAPTSLIFNSESYVFILPTPESAASAHPLSVFHAACLLEGWIRMDRFPLSQPFLLTSLVLLMRLSDGFPASPSPHTIRQTAQWLPWIPHSPSLWNSLIPTELISWLLTTVHPSATRRVHLSWAQSH